MRDMLGEQIYGLTYDGLYSLVKACYLSQVVHSDILKGDSRLANDKEFCTVKFCTSRGAGHSWALSRLAFEEFDNVVFITPNLSMAERMKAIFLKVNVGKFQIVNNYEFKLDILRLEGNKSNMSCDFISNLQLESKRGCFSNVEAVICDCASFLKENQREYIYRNMGACMKLSPSRFFIFAE